MMNPFATNFVMPQAVGGQTVVRSPGGGQFWDEPEKAEWIPAVFHSEIRAQLIIEADQKASELGGYKHPRTAGNDPQDVTSFLASQKDWGKERAHRPEILFQIEHKGRNKFVTAQYWMHLGRVVLDDRAPDPRKPSAYRALRDYGDLPTTISSEIEGWLVEALCRGNRAISVEGEIVPRMLLGKRQQGIAQKVINRARKYRQDTGLLAWVERGNYKHVKEILFALLPAWAVQANSTEQHRDLNAEEVKIFQKAKEYSAEDVRAIMALSGGNEAQPQPTYQSSQKRKAENDLETIKAQKRTTKRPTQSQDKAVVASEEGWPIDPALLGLSGTGPRQDRRPTIHSSEHGVIAAWTENAYNQPLSTGYQYDEPPRAAGPAHDTVYTYGQGLFGGTYDQSSMPYYFSQLPPPPHAASPYSQFAQDVPPGGIPPPPELDRDVSPLQLETQEADSDDQGPGTPGAGN